MAGDVLALPVLIGLGVDQLSMGAVRIYDLCRMIKRIDSGSARLLTTTVLAAGSLESALNNLQRFTAALEKT
jgi:phosphoenolpyruvate-protein kinase (PTS system EI component)